ncbi:MAG: DUF6259 domain-containing protein [Terracidiphilus sp.]
MNRRTFNKLAGLATVSALTTDVSRAAGQAADAASEVVLEDGEFLVAFDRDSGALTRMEYKPTHWVMERRPALGASFRLLAPLPERRDNFVLGQKQKASEVRKVSDSQIAFRWENLLSEHGGVLPIVFTAVVTLANGKLAFNATLENHSQLHVETIDYPYFGDFNPPSRDSSMAAQTMWYGNLGSDEIYPNFGNEKGYWGVKYPTKTFGTQRSLFCLIQAPTQGLYVEMSDPTLPYYLEFTFEQHPGVLHGSVVPKTDEISGWPVHLDFRTCHFVFAHPDTSVKLAPVVLRGYQGDWHAGVDVYKEWRNTWFKRPHLPEWARDVHSWTMLRMNTPEEDYTISYNDFVEYGKEYAANNVRAVQLVGWNKGGQDGDDPSMDIEPHLGTWQQFHDAIAKVQALDVKVILFGKLNWADLTTEWYKTQLYKYECDDPYGIFYQQGGYSYVTPTQLAGINNHRRAVMDFLDPAYRDIATEQFEKALALGAAGWLWDEICHHGPVLYNFAPGHGYQPPGYVYHGDLPLAARLRSVADKVSPDFVFSGEGPQDWLMQYFPVSETGISATPICQYMNPDCVLLAGVSGFDDREQLNMIFLHRYVIQYEPLLYKGHLRDFPLTLAYGKKIDALRKKYKAYIWDGEFRDTIGAGVSADGAHRYSVFVAAGGKRAVIVISQEETRAITVQVNLPNPGNLMVATPEQPGGAPTTGTFRIPARSAAVIIES